MKVQRWSFKLVHVSYNQYDDSCKNLISTEQKINNPVQCLVFDTDGPTIDIIIPTIRYIKIIIRVYE